MIETIKTSLITLLSIYSIVVTYLIWDQYCRRDQYLKDRVDFVNKKTEELNSRERVLINREICDRELTRLKTIHRSALDVLNSYNENRPL